MDRLCIGKSRIVNIPNIICTCYVAAESLHIFIIKENEVKCMYNEKETAEQQLRTREAELTNAEEIIKRQQHQIQEMQQRVSLIFDSMFFMTTFMVVGSRSFADKGLGAGAGPAATKREGEYFDM